MAKKRKKAANNEGSMSYDKKRKQFTYRITYTDYDGNKKRKTFYGQSKSICKQKAEEFKKMKTRNLSQDKEEITVPDILLEFFKERFNSNIIIESTFLRKMYTVSVFQKSNIANIPIVKLTKKDIKQFLNSQTDKSNSDIEKIYSALKKAFKLAICEDIIVKNPLDDPTIQKPKSKKPDKKVIGFTQEEEKKFIEVLKEYKPKKNCNYYKNQFLISLMTGMRMGEINALTPDDIDLINNEIHISKTVTNTIDGVCKIGQSTKTFTGTRTIPIPPSLIPVIKNALDEFVPNKNNLIFFNKNGKSDVISTRQVNNTFIRLCKKAEIKPLGQHMLKHTYATRCIEAKINAPVLKAFLGHTDVSTTINTYVDIFNKFQNEEVQKYEDYMKDVFDIESYLK